jgi:hypothetical protein
MSAMLLTLIGLLTVAVPVLWQDPGPTESIDFSKPARSVTEPQPPFRFLREDFGGTSPKVMVTDASGIEWQVKGGPEARAEAFVSRLAAALGYYTDAICFIPSGRIEGVRQPLKRAAGFISRDGTFTYAGFERRDPAAHFLKDEDWTWPDNPFVDKRELKGLKILIMLVSNWDNKDGRDAGRGSNTGIIEVENDRKVQRFYFVNDWGQSLGTWGRYWRRYWGRSNWKCEGYTRQTKDFITGSKGDLVTFGFGGQHTTDFSNDISRRDVSWLMERLGRISDEQIRAGLKASGASDSEVECFARALRQRIENLRVAGQEAAPAVP